MPQAIKFDWLVYGAGVVDILSSFVARNPWSEIVISIVFWLIMATAAWAVVQRGQRWAAWVVLALACLYTASLIAVWSAPSLFDTALTPLEKVTGVISAALLIVALYNHFGARKPA